MKVHMLDEAHEPLCGLKEEPKDMFMFTEYWGDVSCLACLAKSPPGFNSIYSYPNDKNPFQAEVRKLILERKDKCSTDTRFYNRSDSAAFSEAKKGYVEFEQDSKVGGRINPYELYADLLPEEKQLKEKADAARQITKDRRALLLEWRDKPCSSCGGVPKQFKLFGMKKKGRIIKLCHECEVDWLSYSFAQPRADEI